jgi:hypothetical protein
VRYVFMQIIRGSFILGVQPIARGHKNQLTRTTPHVASRGILKK